MGNNRTAEKRHRQNLKKRMRNRIIKSKVKTLTKEYIAKIDSNSKEEAENIYKTLSGYIDSAGIKGVFHKNNAARKKSRLYKLLAKINQK